MFQLNNFAKLSLWLLIGTCAGFTIIFSSTYLYLSPNLPSVDVLKDVRLQTPLRIYTSDNLLIGEFGEKRRTPITFEQIPTQFVNAILAAEDGDFYSHHGVSIKGLLRAASQLLLTGEKGSGGSTLTMQVARNYFLSFEKTFSRKFNEILLSLQIEREFSKKEILELYVNVIFLGHRAYGIEAASQVYYGKPISELNLPQLAMIAGLPKAPSTYNPIVNPTRALIRRNWILGRMNELGYIDENSYKEAVMIPITARFHGSKLGLNAPYIAEMTRKEMLKRYGRAAYTAGYSVYTTVDSKTQRAAQSSVAHGVARYDQRHGYRGPEAQLVTPLSQENGNADKQPANNIKEDEAQQLTRWREALKELKPVNDLHPAIVSALHENAFSAIMKDGSQVIVEWEYGIKHVRPYLNTELRGPRPNSVEDVVTVNDVIRLQKNADDSWKLTQLPAVQAALVSLDASNGAIQSLVGGSDFQQSKFNRITQAARQPGSNFKPFLYTAALANGFTAASIINDAPIVFEDAKLESSWRPTNDGGKFYGPTRLRYALLKSRNMVSIRLLRALGIRKAINYVGRFGFDSKQLPRDLSLALGSHSLSPIEIVSAYASFANGGFKVTPYFIESIEAIDGVSLFQAMPPTACGNCDQSPEAELGDGDSATEMATIEDILSQPEPEKVFPHADRIIEPRIAYVIDSILKDVVKKGTGRRARSLNRNDLAGKTGTTNGPTDVWFSGYGGGIVTTSWLGFDNNRVLGSKESGSSAALPIWIEYMKTALQDRPQTLRKQPQGVVSVKIDPATGLLAKPGQKNAVFEIFREETAPIEVTGNEDSGSNATQAEDLIADDLF
ncbi:MAG: penicillin-binding protein 1A [Gammaproteobacteria bacterium]|jgi:penicillin-binding protein 1A